MHGNGQGARVVVVAGGVVIGEGQLGGGVSGEGQ